MWVPDRVCIQERVSVAPGGSCTSNMKGSFMLSRMRVASRLAMAFALVLVALVAMWVLSATNIQHALQLSHTMAYNHDRTVSLSSAQGAVWALRLHVAQFEQASDPGQRKQIADLGAAAYKQFDQAMAVYDKAEAGEISTEEEELRRELLTTFQKYTEVRRHWFALVNAGHSEEAAKFRAATLIPADAATLAGIAKLAEEQVEVAERAEQGFADEEREEFVAINLLGAAALVLAVVLTWLIGRSITRPLGQAVGALEAVARGDLTRPIRVESRDELGRLLSALCTTQDSLKDLVAEVIQGAQAVANTSAQIAQGSVDMSQRTEEQATTLEETAGSMEELTATVAQNAEHARQADVLASSASGVASKGRQVVSEMVRTMSDISESSRKIAEIIGVIDGIAFQTNILALNAAVEAARAGDQGRGFAVVAGEVRNLAQRSAEAAKEIKALIGGSVERVEAGTKLVDVAGHTMQEIVGSVSSVSSLISEIASASQEQSQGISQVTSAVSQMEQVVQQNAALVEEATAATESMKAQSAALLRSVLRFKIDAAAVEPRTAQQPRVVSAALPAAVGVH
jgi:methyl-accepting chemotaxis protein